MENDGITKAMGCGIILWYTFHDSRDNGSILLDIVFPQSKWGTGINEKADVMFLTQLQTMGGARPVGPFLFVHCNRWLWYLKKGI
mgnify:CR=1 FL=1